MKTKLLFVLLVAIVNLATAQRIELIRPDVYNGMFIPVKRALNYSEIQGSPYLEDDLVKGYVKFTMGDSLVQFLRYNIYSDEMEYLDEERLMVIDNVNNLHHVYFNDHFIHYKTYKFRNSFKKGYLEILVEGKYDLYVKYEIDFEKGAPAKSSYHQPTPDRFVNKSPTYYYSIDNGTIMNFETDKSGLEAIFRDDNAAVQKYVKDEKLKLRKVEDLIRLFEYCNSNL